MATESASERQSRGQNKELTPEELAYEPAPDLSELEEIVSLSKLTLEHFHALVWVFKQNDPDGEGMELVDFVSTFTNVFQQAMKGKSMKALFEEMDTDSDGIVSFSEFSKYLLNSSQPIRPELSVFRNPDDGVRLPTDHDSPVRVKTFESVPGVLPSINDISKLGLIHMRALLRIFNEADESGEGLDINVFVQTLKEVLPGMDSATLEAMFMKVDANSDGAVSWDELSSYILASGAALDAHVKKNEGGALLQGPETDVNKDVWHHDSISHILCHPVVEKYITVASDARISLNSQNETLVRLWSSKPEDKAAALIPTARLSGPAAIVLSMCLFEHKHEWRNGSIYVLAIASADGRIRFFDVEKLSYAGEFLCHNCMCTTVHNFQIKRDMAVQQKQAASNYASTSDEDLRTRRMRERQQRDLEYQALFCWGDDRGRVHFMLEDAIVEACRKGAYLSSTTVFLEMQVSAENDWLTNIRWIEEMDLLVVTGNKPEVHVLEGKAEQRDANGDSHSFSLAQLAHSGASGKRVTVPLKKCATFGMHSMAVKACTWCVGNKVCILDMTLKMAVSTTTSRSLVVATAGLDRTVFLWDPMFGRLFGRLDGHKKGIVSLQYKEKKDLLISLDNRSVINIWDPSNQALLLSIDPTSSVRSAKAQIKEVTGVCVNPRTEHLIFAHKKPQVWKFRHIEEAGVQREMYHHGDLVAALVNPQFNQLVVVDSHGLVTIWELASGKQTSNFSADTPIPDEHPSSASFDNSYRRLLVCFSQGTIKMYNFSNGSIIQDFVSDATGAITATMVISKEEKGSKKGADKKEQFLLACGWNSVVWVWPSNSSEKTVRSLQKLVPRQSADELDEVKCMAFRAPSTLVTGRKDGQIHMWNTITYSHAAELEVRGEEDWAVPQPLSFGWFARAKGPSPLPVDKDAEGLLSHRTHSDAHDRAPSRSASPPPGHGNLHPASSRGTRPSSKENLRVAEKLESDLSDSKAEDTKVASEVDRNPDNITLPFETDGDTVVKKPGVEVNALTFLNAPGFEALCCAACGDGYLRFYKAKQLWGYLDIKKEEAGGLQKVAIQVLCTTDRHRYLCSGNSKGFVQIWRMDINAFPELSFAFKAESPTAPKRGSMQMLSPIAGLHHRGSFAGITDTQPHVNNMVNGVIECMRFKAHPAALLQISVVERLGADKPCDLLVTAGKEVDGRVYLWNFAGELLGEFGEDSGSMYEPPKKWTVEILLDASRKQEAAFEEFSKVREAEENERREKEEKERQMQEKDDYSMSHVRSDGKKPKTRQLRSGVDASADFASNAADQPAALEHAFSELQLGAPGPEEEEEEEERAAVKPDAKNRGYKDLEPILKQYREQKRQPEGDESVRQRDGGNNPFKTLRTYIMQDDPMIQHNERRKKTAEPKMRKIRPDSADSTIDSVFTKKVADLSSMPGKLNQQLAELSTSSLPAATPRQKYFGQTDVLPKAANRQQRVVSREASKAIGGTPGKESSLKAVVREESRENKQGVPAKKSVLPFIKGSGSQRSD